MHVLDENIPEHQREILKAWRIRFRAVGVDMGRPSTSDENVIPLLHAKKGITFFTLDKDYYQKRLCHASYCLVFLRVEKNRAAETIRLFLRHHEFRTWAQRKGKVIRATKESLRVWRVNTQ